MYSERFTQFSIKNSKGSTNPYILFSDLARYEFDLPPIEEQRKLADLLWAANEAREAYKKLLAATDELVKSQFVEMFGDLTVNDKDWDVKPFVEFAKIDATMTTEYEKYADYPHIGIDSIESVSGELKGYRTVKQDGVKSGKYIFTPAHIIYSKIRPNLNKVAIPTFEGLCSADAYPILNNSDNCDKVFLAYVLRSELFLTYILPFSYRTNFPKVNREQISGFTMPLPPLALQNRFADFVRQADKSKFVARKATQTLKALVL
jgi:type I restriction enzyme S subunit